MARDFVLQQIVWVTLINALEGHVVGGVRTTTRHFEVLVRRFAYDIANSVYPTILLQLEKYT
jgi:hypothetical protein